MSSANWSYQYDFFYQIQALFDFNVIRDYFGTQTDFWYLD